MVLLTLIAVGFLSLSTVALRTSSANEAASIARANARMALVEAIAQLQSLTGPDTRVTASAEMLDPKNPPLTGVWRSWEGLDRDTNGKPIPPDLSQKQQPGDPDELPNAGSPSQGRFLGWLASTPQNQGGPQVPNSISTQPRANAVPMVGEGAVRDPARRVYMQPTLINQGRSGAYAWWTSGENTKAMAQVEPGTAPQNAVDWQERVRSNGRADLKEFGLERVHTMPPTTTIASRNTLDLVSANPTNRGGLFHDLTSYSRGLQVNVATGGWKKDLSLFTERFANYPASGLPTYQTKPGADPVLSSKASTSTPNNTELLYPRTWGAAYRNGGSGAPWQQVPPICSWTALADWATQYTRLTSSSAARTAMPVARASHGNSPERFNFQDQVRRTPQIARIQWIYSLGSVRVEGSNPPRFRPGLLITPALTLWNPYNVELNVSNFSLSIQQTAPLRFSFNIGSASYVASLYEITRGRADSEQAAEYQSFVLSVGNAFTLAPGASRIFGVADTTPRPFTPSGTTTRLDLVPGYRPNGGVLFFGINRGTEVTAAGTDIFRVSNISYDAVTLEGALGGGSKKAGIGIIYDISVDSQSCSAHRMIYDMNELGGSAVVSRLYPPLDTNQFPTNLTIQEVEGANNRPIASALFAYRMASPASTDRVRHRHLFSKGMLQANPLCYYTEIGFGDDVAAITSMQGTGVYHPINAPYDFAFEELDGWSNFRIPKFETSTNNSYIVTGLTPDEGLTRCVMAELPTRPIQSLAELQHFDARNNNPIPPFQFNLIGNGSAQPIFAPDQVSVSTSYNNGMCNDDTFLLNHVLFDDWFVSSISQDLADFSRSPNRDLNRVMQDFLTAAAPLPNRFYQVANPLSADAAKPMANQLTGFSRDPATGLFPYESVAAHIEVPGMFNVNSVSLAAWKAFLKHGRGARIPYLNAGGATTLDTPTTDTHPYPRTSIAGDRAADSGSTDSNALFPEAARAAGYQTFTDQHIDTLAGMIVEEIRKRGPFLSLGEFVNRQLSTNKDLAIASVIQYALDRLSQSSNSPYAPLQAPPAVQITSAPAGQTDYKFPEASMGWSTFGLPGWVRQADVLKPLAPLISVRDDTFVIRAYGDARDRSQPQTILSRAWCEVVLQRKANFVDPVDDAAVRPWSTQMKSEANRRFGRKYAVISFRWLSEKEV